MTSDQYVEKGVKNTSESRVSPAVAFPLEDEMSYLRAQSSDAGGRFAFQLEPRWIALFFCLEGGGELVFPESSYLMKAAQGKLYLLYNPSQELNMQVRLQPDARMVLLTFTIGKIHELFMGGRSEGDLFTAISVQKKYYTSADITPNLYMVLEQLFFAKVPENTRLMYYRAKVLETLSLYFGVNDDIDKTGCPFLNDEATVLKVHKAKEIVIRNMVNPPSIRQLALDVGLNEYQLKVGFKRLYGSPIFQYLNDYRLTHSRNLLQSGRYKVNEVADLIGYTNPSHFIAAFKKKFNITPKKFLTALQNADA